MKTTLPPIAGTDLTARGDRREIPEVIHVDRARLLALLHAARCAKVPASRRSSDGMLRRLAPASNTGGEPTIELRRPVEALADLLTIAEHTTVPLTEVAVCYVGDGQSIQARSLMFLGALTGMDIRIAAPLSLWPEDELIDRAEDLAAVSGARLLVTSDAGHAVLGADVVVAGAWGNWSVLPFDEVAPPSFTVSDEFFASSGLSTTVTLAARPKGRAARTAPRSVALDQVRNRRVMEEVLATATSERDIWGPKVLCEQGTEALPGQWSNRNPWH